MTTSSLPASWALVSIEEVVDINPKSFCPLPMASKLPVHFVPMSAVSEEFGGMDISGTRPLGDVQKGYTAFASNDVLFAKITPCMENGKLAVVPELPEHIGYGSTEFHVLRAGAATTAMWLAHFLSQSEFRRFARQHMSGSAGQLRVSTPWLAAAKIPIAPVKEQARIVDKLEELLSDLDAGVAELKAGRKKLTKYRQSLLNAAVEGALTAEWRKHNKPKETGVQLLERILKERRARWEEKQLAKFKEQGKAPPRDWNEKYVEPVKPDATDLPELPQDWVWASAEQLCDYVTKGTTPPKGLDDVESKTVPFLRVTNLTHNGTLDFTNKVFVSRGTHEGFLERSIVYPGDVLMNIVGPPLGQVSLVPADFDEWNINQAIAIFRAVDGVLPTYICAVLLSSGAQKWLQKRAKTTAGQTNLTLEVCRALPIPLPALVEQIEIVNMADTSLGAFVAQEELLRRSLDQSTAQRKNILKAAFSGQLVAQEPNDEPASVLLERIRAERLAKAQSTTKRAARKQA